MYMHEHSWNNHRVQIYHCDSRNIAYIRLDISVYTRVPRYTDIDHEMLSDAENTENKQA